MSQEKKLIQNAKEESDEHELDSSLTDDSSEDEIINRKTLLKKGYMKTAQDDTQIVKMAIKGLNAYIEYLKDHKIRRSKIESNRTGLVTDLRRYIGEAQESKKDLPLITQLGDIMAKIKAGKDSRLKEILLGINAKLRNPDIKLHEIEVLEAQISTLDKSIKSLEKSLQAKFEKQLQDMDEKRAKEMRDMEERHTKEMTEIKKFMETFKQSQPQPPMETFKQPQPQPQPQPPVGSFWNGRSAQIENPVVHRPNPNSPNPIPHNLSPWTT